MTFPFPHWDRECHTIMGMLLCLKESVGYKKHMCLCAYSCYFFVRSSPCFEPFLYPTFSVPSFLFCVPIFCLTSLIDNVVPGMHPFGFLLLLLIVDALYISYNVAVMWCFLFSIEFYLPTFVPLTLIHTLYSPLKNERPPLTWVKK